MADETETTLIHEMDALIHNTLNTGDARMSPRRLGGGGNHQDSNVTQRRICAPPSAP